MDVEMDEGLLLGSTETAGQVVCDEGQEVCREEEVDLDATSHLLCDT